MSLLLDALKKAAQDKIARSEIGAQRDLKGDRRDDAQHNITSGNSVAFTENAGALAASPLISKDSSKQSKEDVEMMSTIDNVESEVDEFEFTLDADPADMATQRNYYKPETDVHVSETTITSDAEITAKNTAYDRASVTAIHTTVTDEALQLLIHTGNVEHRKRQLVVWGSVFSGSIILLMLAGLYFYIDMEDEIDAMQSKNRQALTALAAQTKIEEHLTSLATPITKPAIIKPDATKTLTSVTPRTTHATKQKHAISVQKTEKRDPVNVLLNRGWSSFQRGEFAEASKAYNEVLRSEARNRDAMLGVAAVAAKRGENEKAREYYLKILELDPLDPYAHAGLASIAKMEGASLSENRLKQLIEKQPEGAHLQFVLGNLYAEQDKWPQAQQAYFQAWQGDSKNADYAFNLAVSLDHLKKYTEAERFYQSSLELARNAKTGFSTSTVEKRLQELRTIK